MRPPQRSRASRIVTCLPARASSRAASRPAAPAPTTTTCCGGCLTKQAVSGSQGPEELPHLLGKRFRLLHCREVAAAGHLAPAADLRIGPLCHRARGAEDFARE